MHLWDLSNTMAQGKTKLLKDLIIIDFLSKVDPYINNIMLYYS